MSEMKTIKFPGDTEARKIVDAVAVHFTKQELSDEQKAQARENLGVSAMQTVSAVDFSNFESGSFAETINGETITHTVSFDNSGRPTSIDGVAINWEAV